MNFGQLKNRVIGTADTPGSAFPQGPPENLVTILNDRLVEAVIAVQKWIPCYQKGHTDVFPACSLMFQRGASVVTKPRGDIHRVYTIGADEKGWDDQIPYNPLEMEQLRRFMAGFRQRYKWLYRTNKKVSGAEAFAQYTADLDSPDGRCQTGVWSFESQTQRLYVAPWIQSTEKLVIEWSGLKRDWTDNDLVPDDPDYLKLIRLYIANDFGRDWAAPDLATRERSFADEQADQIVICNRENLNNAEKPSGVETRESYNRWRSNPPTEPVEAPTSVRIIFVGDTGAASSRSNAVAAAVIAQNPDYVVILGDAVYQPNTVAQALAAYQPLIDANRLAVCLGNHDLDLGLTAVPEYVGNPGNGRYFSIALGPVEIFVANGGLKTDGTAIEPDGNFAGSPQWVALNSWISRSCARHKLLCIHPAPYTSGTRYTPGITSMRWASTMEVNAVLAGHSHNYERLDENGRTHFVVGTGGAETVDGFGTPISGSLARVSADGFLLVEATDALATYQFIDIDGDVRDEIEIEDEFGPPVPPVVVPGTPPTQQLIQEFATRDEMLASTGNWQTARVLNWNPADNIISVWQKAAAGTLLPNGTDVLMTADGKVVFRTFARESLDDTVLPNPVGSAYQAGYPVGFPTYTDFALSTITAPWVFALDEQGNPGTFKRTDEALTHNGVDIVVNAAGVVYRRVGFI